MLLFHIKMKSILGDSALFIIHFCQIEIQEIHINNVLNEVITYLIYVSSDLPYVTAVCYCHCML